MTERDMDSTTADEIKRQIDELNAAVKSLELFKEAIVSTLTLARFCYASFGTFGTMAVGERVLWTVERPWLDNTPSISCIPEGVYQLAPRPFYRGNYDAIEIRDVPARTHILFHKANWPNELAGCIAPNAIIGPGDWSCPLRGYDSAAAFAHLMEWFESGGQLRLAITRPQPTTGPAPIDMPDMEAP